jgi:hypothetical protein
VATHYRKNIGSRIADQRWRTTQFLNVVDQREVEARFLNSGPAEEDHGKNSGCPSLLTVDQPWFDLRKKELRGREGEGVDN